MLLGSALALTGCAQHPLACAPGVLARAPERTTASPALQYWLRLSKADKAAQDLLWREASRDREVWKLGLLQSMAGSAHYDPESARKRLRATLSRPPSPDVAAVAQLRLQELATEQRYEARLGGLQKRLDEVVEIERRMERR